MTQIEKIIAEIERLMNWKPKAIPSGMRQRDVLNIRKGVLLVLKYFINSLPESQPSENLEEYYTKDFLPKEWFAKQGQRTLSEFNFFTASHFAQWQKEQIINEACQWLQHNAEKYVASYGLPNYQTGLLLNDFKHAMEDTQ